MTRFWGRNLPRLTIFVGLACLLAQGAEPATAARAAGQAAAAGPVAAYTYDADGRLSTVTDAAGDLATYHYDAVGNVTSITRTDATPQPSAQARAAQDGAAPHVTSVQPSVVQAGRPVTIDGTGFNPRTAADTVRIGALLATVTAASATRLTVTAPPGKGGPATVRTPGGASTGGSVTIHGGPQPVLSRTSKDLQPLRAPAGVTALAGQIQTASGTPLAGVTVRTHGTRGSAVTSAVTNAAGQFLLPHLAAGWGTLTLDASHLPGGRDYGTYAEPVQLPAGRTTVLPWISYMTSIDTAHAITLTSPAKHAMVLTTPRIPGLKVLIPAGTVIRDDHGKVVRSLSITPLPTDRTPMPWGAGMVPRYFTVQPAGLRYLGLR